MVATVSYVCSACGKRYRLPVVNVGRTATCKCGHRGTVAHDEPAELDVETVPEEQPGNVRASKKPALVVVDYTGPMSVYIDGYVVSDPDEERRTRFRLTPGKHTIFVRWAPRNLCGPCYSIDVRPGDKIEFECAIEDGKLYFHWTEYRTHGEIKEVPLPGGVCHLKPAMLRKIWKRAPKEKPVWERALRRTNALVATGVPMVFLLFFLLFAVSGGGEVRIKLINTKVPAWVVGLCALGSVIAFVAVLVQPARRLTITNRRTIFQCGGETIEIAHADLGAVSVERTTETDTGFNLTRSDITIRSETTPALKIVISDADAGGEIKNILDEFKRVASGAEPLWAKALVPAPGDGEAEEV